MRPRLIAADYRRSAIARQRTARIASMRPRLIAADYIESRWTHCRCPPCFNEAAADCRGLPQAADGAAVDWRAASMRPRLIAADYGTHRKSMSCLRMERCLRALSLLALPGGTAVHTMMTFRHHFSQLLKTYVAASAPRELCHHQSARNGAADHTITGSLWIASNRFPRLLTRGCTRSAGPRSRIRT